MPHCNVAVCEYVCSMDLIQTAREIIKHHIGPQPTWPPRQLSLALQGGGSFGAFTWGVLDRLLQEPTISLDTISGASAGAVNAVLLACGLVEGGRKRAREKLDRFWKRITDDASLLSLMAIPNYPQPGTLGMFGRALSPAQFNPFDFNPLRRLLATEIY